MEILDLDLIIEAYSDRRVLMKAAVQRLLVEAYLTKIRTLIPN
jgi:hypothetical protein